MNPGVRIKTFHARSLAEALDRVRKEFGPEALILDTESAQGSRFSWGASKVRVTASSPPAPTATVPRSDDTDPHAPEIVTVEPTASVLHIPIHNASLRSDCRNPSEPLYSPAYLQASQLLGETDLDPALTREWLGNALKFLGTEVTDPWVIQAWIAQRIRNAVAIDPPTIAWSHSRCVVALIGPSGQGKSSATAKLAGLAALQLQRRPAILSCDPEGLHATHRLADYCQLMGWGFEQIDAPKSIATAMQRLSEYDLVLLDTPCIRPGDFEAMDALRRILSEAEVSQTHLVVSALLGTTHFRRVTAWYQQLEPSHLMLTKLDEAQGLSGVFSSLIASHLPLGFASTGPGVPEDVVELDAVQVAQWVLGD